MEGSLTPGQAITLARNEQVLERLTEEIEDFEDLLKDSIRESLSAKEKKVKLSVYLRSLVSPNTSSQSATRVHCWKLFFWAIC